ncbi:MAG: TolC family protein, partial [Bacteroidales bacterium]
MNKYIFLIGLLLTTGSLQAQNQERETLPGSADYVLHTYNLTLEEVLHLAATQSNEALRARNTFQVGYWEYRSYKANFLPNLM